MRKVYCDKCQKEIEMPVHTKIWFSENFLPTIEGDYCKECLIDFFGEKAEVFFEMLSSYKNNLKPYNP